MTRRDDNASASQVLVTTADRTAGSTERLMLTGAEVRSETLGRGGGPLSRGR
jgi:hypothetical protein